MIRTLDETIIFYKKKYELLKDYDNLKAEEYRELADWLIDYKRLKAKEETEKVSNRWNMIKETRQNKE